MLVLIAVTLEFTQGSLINGHGLGVPCVRIIHPQNPIFVVLRLYRRLKDPLHLPCLPIHHLKVPSLRHVIVHQIETDSCWDSRQTIMDPTLFITLRRTPVVLASLWRAILVLSKTTRSMHGWFVCRQHVVINSSWIADLVRECAVRTVMVGMSFPWMVSDAFFADRCQVNRMIIYCIMSYYPQENWFGDLLLCRGINRLLVPSVNATSITYFNFNHILILHCRYSCFPLN
jgi:hypothetical protein